VNVVKIAGVCFAGYYQHHEKEGYLTHYTANMGERDMEFTWILQQLSYDGLVKLEGKEWMLSVVITFAIQV